MYLSPFSHVPSDRAIQDIAVSSIGGRWLRTQVIWNKNCLAGALCHFVNTGNVTSLYADTARAHASGEFAVIPSANVDDSSRKIARIYVCIQRFFFHMKITNYYIICTSMLRILAKLILVASIIIL